MSCGQVGLPEATLAEEDEPMESPEPAQGAAKSVFGEFSGLARTVRPKTKSLRVKESKT